MISAKILKDSVSPDGSRLTTFELEYPRYILSELNTHRVFSRNTASSRAIPLDRMIENILETDNVPIWTENKSGMQGDIIRDQNKLKECESIWRAARLDAIKYARQLAQIGVHKQNFNRLLEPFQTVKTILSGTNFDNFFKLRIHKDAMPEIRELATLMKQELDNSEPELLDYGEWHMPYISDDDIKELGIYNCKRISVSCCAQVSYRKLNATPEKALEIYCKLIQGDIIHGSAFEHVATPCNEPCKGNFKGWRQFRHDIEGV